MNFISRRSFLKLTGAATVLSLREFIPTTLAGTGRKPNVVFILCDDLGYADIGCYGQKIIRTPNIDRMAAEGMRFTQHYSGFPVCAPSRCVLMTGKHSGHAFIRDNRGMKPEGQYPIPTGTITLAELFKQQRYTTGAFGKWGLGSMDSTGSPLKQGFDRFFGYNCQSRAHNLYPPSLWDNDKSITLNNDVPHPPQKLSEGTDPNDPANYSQFVGKDYAPDLYMEQARRFLRENKDKPFFLFVPTIIPHLALQVPEDSLAEYRGKFSDPPYPGGRGYLPHFSPRAAYAAMITRMDREVGSLMTLVKEFGLDDNTIFVFSSDNGPLNGKHQGLAGTDAMFFNSAGGLRDGKGSVYEGGIRVPCIVRWQGKIAAGTTSDRVTGFEDWIPTLMDLIGMPDVSPKDVDGLSFAPTLLDKSQEARPFLYREFPGYGGQQSVRIGDWKGVRQNLVPRGRKAQPNLHIELYNLKNDISESKDVSEQHPDIVAKIEKIMCEQHRPSAEFPLVALDQR
ncbi:MAG: arylsulfatase [Kiritimatiellae bacterium]|nr:arylsulfatase [Kiritimatiellia bacterium]MDD5519689.1 arylsulfatase [Kiritimatiellia bacterium]